MALSTVSKCVWRANCVRGCVRLRRRLMDVAFSPNRFSTGSRSINVSLPGHCHVLWRRDTTRNTRIGLCRKLFRSENGSRSILTLAIGASLRVDCGRSQRLVCEDEDCNTRQTLCDPAHGLALRHGESHRDCGRSV